MLSFPEEHTTFVIYYDLSVLFSSGFITFVNYRESSVLLPGDKTYLVNTKSLAFSYLM